MPMVTYPLNNIEYTAEDAELFHSTRTSGVYAIDSFDYSVSGADNTIVIGTGIAWIKNSEFSGKVIAQKESISLDMGLPDSVYPRIDAIVIQFNSNNNGTEIIVKNGTAATNPNPPAVVRTESVYELHLYHVLREAGSLYITPSNITDLRLDSSCCGLMADSVTNIDTTAIERQVADLIESLQNEISNVIDGSAYLLRNGSTNMTGNLPMNGHKVTELGMPTADGDAVPKKYIDNLSASDVGAVSKTGDTMTGALNVNGGIANVGDTWNAFTFRSATSGNPVRGSLMISNNNRIHFNQQQTGASAAERYQLPALESGLTGDKWYNFVTTKAAKVLWTNASLTSSFAAQTITVAGLSGCECIAVVLNHSNGDAFVTLVHRNVSGTLATTPSACRNNDGSGFYVVHRSVTTNFTNGTIYFGKGYQNGAERNDRAIPVAVIGLY